MQFAYLTLRNKRFCTAEQRNSWFTQPLSSFYVILFTEARHHMVAQKL